MPHNARGDDMCRAGVRVATIMSVCVLFPVGCATSPAPSTGTSGTSSVVGGITERDYNYPWVVRLNGCGGVLIDPQWVLTAAHCVTPNIGIGELTYKRTDPQTGAEITESIGPDQNIGPANNRGVFIQPGYDPQKDQANDIALIKLAKPFAIEPLIQTVGLPNFSRLAGVVGNLANYSHTATLPTGYVAVFRAPMPANDYPPRFLIPATAAGASLCPGDSGSGFVTVESGRATVRGLASMASITNCMTPSGEAVFTDVFTFREWILQTMDKSDASLTGNTRVRWTGRAAAGRMGVECPASPSRSGPLNVAGVEEGINCSAGQAQALSCNVAANQRHGSEALVLSGIAMTTFMQDGTSIVQNNTAHGNNVRLHETFPPGAVSREFTCQIGLQLRSGPIKTNTVAASSSGK